MKPSGLPAGPFLEPVVLQPRSRAPTPPRAHLGALLAREGHGSHPGHGAGCAGEGQPRVLGPGHAGVRLFARVQADTGRELGTGQAHGYGADCEWRGRHAPEWMVEWTELSRGGA
jgi:hypothetical protein